MATISFSDCIKNGAKTGCKHLAASERSAAAIGLAARGESKIRIRV
jgi:hypothetical protein